MGFFKKNFFYNSQVRIFTIIFLENKFSFVHVSENYISSLLPLIPITYLDCYFNQGTISNLC